MMHPVVVGRAMLRHRRLDVKRPSNREGHGFTRPSPSPSASSRSPAVIGLAFSTSCLLVCWVRRGQPRAGRA